MAGSLDNTVYCGCGGGFDIFGAIPFLHRNKGAATVLVSLSFTPTSRLKKYATSTDVAGLYAISENEYKEEWYFPEAHLVNSLAKHHRRDQGAKWSCYVIDYSGLFTNDLDCPCPEGKVCTCDWTSLPDTITLPLQQFMDAYRYIASKHRIKEWNLVDGGCDVLMQGIEKGLGTPQEDFLSLFCSNILVKEHKIASSRVLVVGAPLEQKDGILLKDIRERTGKGCTEWVWSKDQPEIELYMKVAQDAYSDMSTIHSMIIASLEGHTGQYTPPRWSELRNEQKNGVPLDKSVCTMYTFDLAELAKRNQMLDGIQLSWSLLQLDDWIDECHKRLFFNQDTQCA